MDTQELKALYVHFLKYFKIEEIVSPEAYKKYKKFGDNFFLSRFDPRLLATMVFIRETLDKPITINTWLWGGEFDERGLRDTSTPMVQARAKKGDPWLSPHPLSMAFDFDVEGMTANEVRAWLKKNATALPYPIRLERKFKGKYISWVHLDVCFDPKNPKVYEFDI